MSAGGAACEAPCAESHEDEGKDTNGGVYGGCDEGSDVGHGGDGGDDVQTVSAFEVEDARDYHKQLDVVRRLRAAGAGVARMKAAAAHLGALKRAAWVPRGTVSRKKRHAAGDSAAALPGASGGDRDGNGVPRDRDAAAVASYPPLDPPPLDDHGFVVAFAPPDAGVAVMAAAGRGGGSTLSGEVVAANHDPDTDGASVRVLAGVNNARSGNGGGGDASVDMETPEAIARAAGAGDGAAREESGVGGGDAMTFFRRYGFVVFRGVLSAAECATTRDEVWDYLERRHRGDADASGGTKGGDLVPAGRSGGGSDDDDGGKGRGDGSSGGLLPPPPRPPLPPPPLRRDDPSTYGALSSVTYGLAPEPAVFTPQLVRNRQNPRVVASLACTLACAWGRARSGTPVHDSHHESRTRKDTRNRVNGDPPARMDPKSRT
jgi:hypothetical protein